MLMVEGQPRLPWLGRECGLRARGPGCARFSSMGALFLAFVEGRVPDFETKMCFILLHIITCDCTVLFNKRCTFVFLC